MNFTDFLVLAIILLIGFWSAKQVWKWLSKKQFKFIESKKWLKVIISAVCGYVLCAFVIIIGGIKLINKGGDHLSVN